MTRAVSAPIDDAPADEPADTRERLLHVAMALFAAHGIDRISLKMISDAAGNRNKSAVGYHFESKQGLIDAVLRRLERDLGPPMTAALSSLETALDGGAVLSVSDVVIGLLRPVLRLYTAKPYGPDAFRVLARLMHDPVEGVPRDLRVASAALVDRAVRLLHRLMPNKPAYLIQHHMHHAVMATVNGLALQERFIARHNSLWTRETLDDIFNSYAGYLTAGLSAMPLVPPPGQIEPWTRAADPTGPKPPDRP